MAGVLVAEPSVGHECHAPEETIVEVTTHEEKDSERVLLDPVQDEEPLSSSDSGASPERKKSKSKSRHKRKDVKMRSEPVFSHDTNETEENGFSPSLAESEGGEVDFVSVSEGDLGNMPSPELDESEEKRHRKKRKKEGRGKYVQTSVVIVAVIVVQDGKLLMMQEAKPTCRGKWYIPAGRVELGESPYVGAEREVEEETGLIMRATGIFCVEYKASRRERRSGYNNWIRYGVTGEIVGGELKTEAQADKESIQARWVPLDEVQTMDLRNEDFLGLLEEYNSGKTVPVVYSLKK